MGRFRTGEGRFAPRLLVPIMKDKTHWMELCEQAAVEQDPAKLLKLVTEINRLLEEKEKRVGIVFPPKEPGGSG